MAGVTREYRKQCACFPMTATRGRCVMGRSEFDEGTQIFRAPVTFYPGPVCDVCDTPWKEVKP